MDELTLDHDRFRQSLMEQTRESQCHPLIKQIDEWEKQSIEKIHRLADDARKQLRNTINDQPTKLREALTKITEELCEARANDDFFETDLQRWTDKLEQLKTDLAHPQDIQILQEAINTDSLFVKITPRTSTTEKFIQSIGDIQIEDSGYDQVYLNGICHQKFNNYKSDIEKNDIVQLLLDCDHRILRLTNERTQSVFELPIEMNKCPLPWQLNFNLYGLNDRIRILQHVKL